MSRKNSPIRISQVNVAYALLRAVCALMRTRFVTGRQNAFTRF
jgi:hypothetical protein